MRKFTSLMLSLIAFVGIANAQITSVGELSNDKVYTVTPKDDTRGTLYATSTSTYLTACGGTRSNAANREIAIDATSKDQQFAFYTYDGTMYMFSVGAQKFINDDSSSSYFTLTEKPLQPVAVVASDIDGYFIVKANGRENINVSTGWDYGAVGDWNSTDDGNRMKITAVADMDVDTKAALETIIALYATIDVARTLVANSSDTRVGAYTTESVTALSTALAKYDNDQSEENFNAVKKEYDDVITNGKKVTLAAGEIFKLKCYDTSRGYLAYSTVEGMGSETAPYLAGTSKTELQPATDADGVYLEWAIISHKDKAYMYNIENKMFINSDNIVQFTETPAAFSFIEMGNNIHEIQFESNNRYLSFSPGWGANCVRTEAGTDEGCMFYIDKTGETASIETLSTVEASFVNEWKENTIATLGYVGSYPSSMSNAVNAVSTLSAISAFETDNAASRIALTNGYYFIQNTNTNKYATYSGNNFVVESLADGEKPGVENICKFVTEDGVTKLAVANVGKYVTLADAPAVSSVSSDFASGATFTIEVHDYAKCLVKGNNEVMRTENNGDVNYWWGDITTTWYLIPATEIEVTINEFASICLPFAVEPTGDVKAYAVEETTGTHALLAEKADIAANQGAILAGNGTFTFKIKDEATSDWNSNKLAGTTTNSYIAPVGTAYVLAKPEGSEIGLYKATLNCDANGAEGDTHFLNNANKAYLDVTTADPAPSYSFSFDWAGTTGIEGVAAEGAQDGAIYDITGRRVKAITAPGIYIVNGRKVVK